MKPEYFRLKEAATYSGSSASTLAKLQTHGGGPQFIKMGRAVRYRKNDLDHFVRARLMSSTFEGA